MDIPFSPPDIRDEDIAAVVAVLRSGWITSGPVGRQFEAALSAYAGTGGAVALNSGTAALELALRVLDVGPGDEVIVPAYTYTASAAVVAHVGAQIVLVDVAPGAYVPRIQDILDAVTPRTKAVIVVDLGGVPYDAEGIRAALDGAGIASENPIVAALGRPAVIVDGAHSLGATLGGCKAGQMGDFTGFSFHAVKNLTTAEGGALVWRGDLPVDHAEMTATVRRLSLHGQTKDAFSKAKAGAWEYDILELAYKCNMPDTLAALGLSQLPRYEDAIARRQQIVRQYDALLGERFTSLRHATPTMRSSAHLHMVDLGAQGTRRNLIIESMANSGVATNIHYKPLPLLTAYQNLGFSIDDFPNAYEQYQREITLPLNTVLTDSQVERVATTLLSATADGI